MISMSTLEYQTFVASRTKPMDDPKMRLLHAAVGMATEASGELLDAVKAHVFYGKPLDDENVLEELGDEFFYMNMLMNEKGITLADIMSYNVEKLQKRYKEKFTEDEAVARADKRPDTDSPSDIHGSVRVDR